MAKRRSGKRYAQAIFELAVAQGQVDQWADELRWAAQVLQDTDFSAFLKHAEVPAGEKVKAIDAVLGDIHPLVRNLTSLLVLRGMVEWVDDVHADYSRLLDEHRGRQRVEVIAAVPLEDRELARLSRFMADLIRKEVVLSAQVDESILGGVIIQIGDQLLDGSTRFRLETLRHQLHGG